VTFCVSSLITSTFVIQEQDPQSRPPYARHATLEEHRTQRHERRKARLETKEKHTSRQTEDERGKEAKVPSSRFLTSLQQGNQGAVTLRELRGLGTFLDCMNVHTAFPTWVDTCLGMACLSCLEVLSHGS
jgi:hypothetical protein